MSRTVPCPHSVSSHKKHYEDSREFRECEERERRRVRRLRRLAIERFRAGTVVGVPSTAGSALTFTQKLGALGNPPRPKDKSDGPSFGG